MSDSRIYCDTVLLGTGWARDQVISVAGGRIESVAPGVPADADDRLTGPVIPGIPNAHSHGFQRLIAGRTGAARQAADSFWTWREAMYRLAGRITAERFEDCLAWVYAEMLKAGYTCCAEFHYLHHRPDGSPCAQRAEMSLRVLAAADAAGMPVTLLPVLYRSSGFGQPVTVAQRRFHNTLEEYIGLVDDCRRALRGRDEHVLGIAPHSLRAVPASDLSALADCFAGDPMPVHVHVAEQQREVDDCLEHLGARPVQWMLDNLPVGERWCLVHATHMSEDEVRRAAATGAVAGLCPSTEADLGDGVFDLLGWLKAGGRFAIGSDSNVRISVAGELRMLELQERLRLERRNVLSGEGRSCGRYLLEQAAASGAAALGRNAGAIETGRRADLVELDGGHPLLAGRRGEEILDSFVFAGGGEMVRTVFAGGRRVVSEGRHLREAELRPRFDVAMREALEA